MSEPMTCGTCGLPFAADEVEHCGLDVCVRALKAEVERLRAWLLWACGNVKYLPDDLRRWYEQQPR